MRMVDEFSLPWINVLDESMMEWFNKYALASCVLVVNLTLLETNGIRFAAP
jgi:hypothetical protein